MNNPAFTLRISENAPAAGLAKMLRGLGLEMRRDQHGKPFIQPTKRRNAAQ